MRIVEPLDILEHCGSRFGVSPEVMPIEQLVFKVGEEALGHRVVEAIADRSHRQTDAEFFAALSARDRGVLATVVGVMNDFVRTTLRIHSFNRGEHQSGGRGLI